MKTSALMRLAYEASQEHRESVLRILVRAVASGTAKVERSVRVRAPTRVGYYVESFDPLSALKVYLYVVRKLQGGNKK